MRKNAIKICFAHFGCFLLNVYICRSCGRSCFVLLSTWSSCMTNIAVYLQELQQEKMQQQLLSPLPFPTTLPLLSACVASAKTVVADPVHHLQVNHCIESTSPTSDIITPIWVKKLPASSYVNPSLQIH